MKLSLICVFMGLGFTFADLVDQEEPSTKMGVQKRGESYDQCIEAYLSDAEAEFADADNVTREAVSDAADYIRTCLSENTDEEADTRRQGTLDCAAEVYSDLEEAMVNNEKSDIDVDRVVIKLREYQVKAMSYDPAIGCHVTQ